MGYVLAESATCMSVAVKACYIDRAWPQYIERDVAWGRVSVLIRRDRRSLFMCRICFVTKWH